MSKHTPGPWRYQDIRSSGEHVYFRIESKNGAVGFAYKSDNAEGNARLIAAAPDLLAALRKIATNEKLGTGDCMEIARTALAKAAS